MLLLVYSLFFDEFPLEPINEGMHVEFLFNTTCGCRIGTNLYFCLYVNQRKLCGKEENYLQAAVKKRFGLRTKQKENVAYIVKPTCFMGAKICNK